MPNRRALLAAIAATGAGALAACARGEDTPPKADGGPGSSDHSGSDDSGASDSSGADLTAEQYERIVGEVAGVISAADEALDAEKLKERAEGTMLDTRAAQYELGKKNRAFFDAPAISGDSLLGILSTDRSFPRTTCALTADPAGDGPGRFLFMSQADARASYKVWGFALQIPETDQPMVHKEQSGNAFVPQDSTDLRAKPIDAVNLYLSTLTDGNDKDTDKLFADDGFRTQVQKNVSDTQAALDQGVDPGSVAAVKESFELVDGEYAGLSTVDGGALTAFSFRSDFRISAQNEATLRDSSDDVEAVLGKTSFSSYLSRSYGGTVLLYIPPKGADDQQLQCIGAYKMLMNLVGE